MMQLIEYPKRKDWYSILSRPLFRSEKTEKQVSEILENVKSGGDEAVRRYSERFDHVRIEQFSVTEAEMKEALDSIDPELEQAMEIASINIRKFHEAQIESVKEVETMPGVMCWQKAVPIEKVGLYIPGGTAPLFSTVLMLAIPANIAGCGEIILCTPPGENGKVDPAILYAAYKTGVKNIFKVGGVQAIGAMAYGTETIPAVYKIFGPGNQYVTTAKQLVSRDGIAIDMPAGPSEVAIMADNSCVPEFVASDLLAQAEHGIDSQVILVSTEINIIQTIHNSLQGQLEKLTRKDIAIQSLKNSKAIVVGSEKEMTELINQYAPEHLIISMHKPRKVAEGIINAGSVFIGNYTPESAGDYASGTNHTLPTNGYARSFSGVNLDSYLKKITFQEITRKGLEKLGPFVEKMAEKEKLIAHKNAVTIRLK